jgi:cell division protein FtsB
MMTDEMVPKDRSKIPLKNIWYFAIIVLGILILGDLNRRMSDARQLENDLVVLQTEVAGLEASNLTLQVQLTQAVSDAMVAEWAHGDARMVRPGEHLIIPLPAPGASPASSAIATPTIPAPKAWDVWRALLFGR